MELSTYLKRFDSSARADFALQVGTTLGHLNNVCYGARFASAALARQIAMRTGRDVPEWHLRPADWHLIWPELVGIEGAPAVPSEEAQRAAPSCATIRPPCGVADTAEAGHAG